MAQKKMNPDLRELLGPPKKPEPKRPYACAPLAAPPKETWWDLFGPWVPAVVAGVVIFLAWLLGPR